MKKTKRRETICIEGKYSYEAGIFPVRKEKDYFPAEKVNIRNTGIFVRTIKGVIVYGGLGLNDFGLKSCILKKVGNSIVQEEVW